MKEYLKAILPDSMKEFLRKFRKSLFDIYALKSYSQEGEDMILRYIFGNQKTGFYVDVGAHHPKRFSNTCFFYKKGWRGINIDTMPGSMEEFNKRRPRDINVELAISSKKHELTYYIFDEPALNSFSKELSESRGGCGGKYKIIDVKKLETFRLEEVLDKHLPKNQIIDFMSVDVEGLDFDVLVSNNWNKYKPKVLLVEIYSESVAGLMEHEITKFLKNYGYIIFAKCPNTVIFKFLPEV
ncbi:MAG: FkbM family methyltransferase [Candidatus Omnitrophota bacterium]